jgi:hypothetical protein
MNATTAAPPRHRHRPVLRTVSAGRCAISERACGTPLVDGRCVTDRFAGPRLIDGGVTAVGPQVGPARLAAFGPAEPGGVTR